MSSKKIWLCFFLFFVMSNKVSVSAQTNDEIRKHVIVAIDVRPGPSGDYGFADVLKNAEFMSKKITNILSEIINDDDYISVVDYGLPTMAESFNDYTTCTVGWNEYGKWRNSLPGTWGVMAYNQHFPDKELYSLITGAKFFSFMALKEKNGEMLSNKVYILTVSDDEYNGSNDYKTEFKKGYYETTFSQNGGRLTPDEYRNTCISISNKWSFLWEKDYVLKSLPERNYYATLYEVVPNDRPSLPSAVSYPANLGLNRIRGNYELDFDYSSSLSNYKVKKLEIDVLKNGSNDSDDDVVISEDYMGDDGHIHIIINNDSVTGNNLNVKMRVWLEKQDDIYTGLLLNPYDKNSDNLTTAISLTLPERKKILGFIPLYDEIWWMCPNNPDTMVGIWTGILIFLLCMLVTYILRKIIIAKSTYTPDDHSINISHT